RRAARRDPGLRRRRPAHRPHGAPLLRHPRRGLRRRRRPTHGRAPPRSLSTGSRMRQNARDVFGMPVVPARARDRRSRAAPRRALAGHRRRPAAGSGSGALNGPRRARALIERITRAFRPRPADGDRPVPEPSTRDAYTRDFPPLTTMEDVIAAYRLFLRRNADEGGVEHYRGLIAKGLKLDEFISIFMNSEEYRRFIVPLLPGELRGNIGPPAGAARAVPAHLRGST